MLSRYKHIVNVTGLGFSGVSCVMDFLREFDNFTIYSTAGEFSRLDKIDNDTLFEFNFLYVAGSLYELENLLNSTEPIQGAAIHRFIALNYNIYKHFKIFNTPKYIRIAQEFINKIAVRNELLSVHQSPSIPFITDTLLAQNNDKQTDILTPFMNYEGKKHYEYIPRDLTIEQYTKIARDFIQKILRILPSKEYLALKHLGRVPQIPYNCLKKIYKRR